MFKDEEIIKLANDYAGECNPVGYHCFMAGFKKAVELMKEFPEIKCPNCGEDDQGRLEKYIAEEKQTLCTRCYHIW